MEQHNEGLEQPAQQPTLCVTGCGFFANCGSGGMCSKCFREAQQTSEQPKQRSTDAMSSPCVQQASSAAAAAAPSSAVAAAAVMQQPPAAASEPAAAPAAAAEAGAAAPAEPKVSTRCNQCRKKVGLTGFKCKCGLLFCGQHRYAEAHDCGFDYKTMQREKLAAANPVVQAAKVERI